MTGTAEPIREPKNDAEWARSTQRRIESAENPTSVRAGEWVFSTSTEGHLIASHVAGGSVIIARKPSGGENDPDAITDNAWPAVTATRTAAQTITGSGGVVMFDGVSSEVGDWTAGMTLFDSMRVPETGVYDISATAFLSQGGGLIHLVVLVDTVTSIGGRMYEPNGISVPCITIAGQLSLTAGQSVQLFVSPPATRTVGAATIFTTAIPTSLSLSLTSRGG
ncbi:hypothetical protein [Nocardia farcinica]|uniref:hypothetical protein n=1 Tax=Nocardia farcinica TaxID=37329 RepID=UPI002457F073|nr:hypothetical protein [Nocardia farcinica]